MNNIRMNIEMFKEAHEIQALVPHYAFEAKLFCYAQEWESGDYQIHYGFGDYLHDKEIFIPGQSKRKNGNKLLQLIWLPLEEQLQDMISTDIIAKHMKYIALGDSLDFCRLRALNIWIGKLSTQRHNYAMNGMLTAFSMKELLLAFIMSEKYQKIWDGKHWKI